MIATGVVEVPSASRRARHDELHPLGINVYLPERDGVRLTAARTLSPDPLWRQLSVRRLMTMLRRVLERQMQWAVFEPNDDAPARATSAHMLAAYLRQLFAANAFAAPPRKRRSSCAATTTLNPPPVVDAGRLYRSGRRGAGRAARVHRAAHRSRRRRHLRVEASRAERSC